MTAAQSTTRPDKPYPGFPLRAHARGYWMKWSKGKDYNCGPWSDPDAALNRWYQLRSDLELGIDPKPSSDAVTIDLLVNAFLDAKDAHIQIPLFRMLGFLGYPNGGSSHSVGTRSNR